MSRVIFQYIPFWLLRIKGRIRVGGNSCQIHLLETKTKTWDLFIDQTLNFMQRDNYMGHTRSTEAKFWVSIVTCIWFIIIFNKNNFLGYISLRSNFTKIPSFCSSFSKIRISETCSVAKMAPNCRHICWEKRKKKK